MLRGGRYSVEASTSLALAALMVLFPAILAAAPAASVSAAPRFVTSGVQVRALPAGSLPFQSSRPMALAGTGLMDAGGVRMFSFNGRIWNHPVGQAQYALANLDAYRLTGTKAYLDRAIANAQRLVDLRVEIDPSIGGGLRMVNWWGKAWFFPYPFDFACCQGDTTMVHHAPWYSGMAQGEALSVFARLFEATGNQAWRHAADATFDSLLVNPSATRPWGVWVDGAGHLWLEEYPRWPVETSERVLNGHLFAAFGLYDYFRLTNDPRALQLFDGAVTTVEQLVPAGFRRVNWAAAYSLQHGIPNAGYHLKVISQLLYLQHMTGRSQDALLADTLRADYPLPTSSGTGNFTPSATRAYKLDSNLKIISSKGVVFTGLASIPVDRRVRIQNGPIMLRVSAGDYANWWFPEGAGAAWISGPVVANAYDPTLTATFSPGTFTAYSFDASGNEISHQSVPVTATTQWPTDSSAIVNGSLAYHFTSGPFAGFWSPAVTALAIS